MVLIVQRRDAPLPFQTRRAPESQAGGGHNGRDNGHVCDERHRQGRFHAEANPGAHGLLLPNFDQQSAMLACTMRPWEAGAGPSRQWEPYREAAAIVMAKLLARLAEVPFARLYRSALADADLNGVSPRRQTGTSSGRAK